jgi:hypothetical protein
MLVKALESDWAVLAEEIGLWIPVEVVNEEHNDKPDGVDDSGNCFSFSIILSLLQQKIHHHSGLLELIYCRTLCYDTIRYVEKCYQHPL